MPEHSQACFDVQTQRCVCPIENKGARVRAAGPALLAMLLRLEWGMDKDGWLSCPMCFVAKSHDSRVPSLHEAGCMLAALLDPLR